MGAEGIFIRGDAPAHREGLRLLGGDGAPVREEALPHDGRGGDGARHGSRRDDGGGFWVPGADPGRSDREEKENVPVLGPPQSFPENLPCHRLRPEAGDVLRLPRVLVRVLRRRAGQGRSR